MKRKFIGWSRKQQLFKVIDPVTEKPIQHIWASYWMFFFFWAVVYKRPMKDYTQTIVDLDGKGNRRYERTTLILPVVFILAILMPGCTQNNYYEENNESPAADVCYICSCTCEQ